MDIKNFCVTFPLARTSLRLFVSSHRLSNKPVLYIPPTTSTPWRWGKPSHLDAAVCPRVFHWILLLRNFKGNVIAFASGNFRSLIMPTFCRTYLRNPIKKNVRNKLYDIYIFQPGNKLMKLALVLYSQFASFSPVKDVQLWFWPLWMW